MPVVQDIRKMARGGSTVAEISRETGVSEPTVRKYINMDDFSPKVPVKKRISSRNRFSTYSAVFAAGRDCKLA